MTGPSSAVTVARSVADAVVELAWATRPGQPLSDVDRYVVVTALGAAAAVLPQVLTQARQGVPDSRDAAREALHAATVAAHDLAHLLDAAAQYLA